jgi:hypothetical protein
LIDSNGEEFRSVPKSSEQVMQNAMVFVYTTLGKSVFLMDIARLYNPA